MEALTCLVATSALAVLFVAYLDPGTGSIIIQALIGGLVGALFALKLFWRRIVAFFRNLFSKQERREERHE